MLQVEVARTAELTERRLAAVRTLLLDAFDGEFSEHDWQHTVGGWHVIVGDDVPLAHAAVVPRMLEIGTDALRAGYVEGVATAPARRRQGLGTRVMREIGRLIRSEFELGALSTSAHEFYERTGWERWQGPSFVRRGDVLVRTADEDDGIMVLRVGATVGLDLDQPICCDPREGDDW